MQQIEKIVVVHTGEYVVRVQTAHDMETDSVRLYRNRVRVLPSRVAEGTFEWRGPLTHLDMIEASTGDLSPIRLTVETTTHGNDANQ